MQVHRDEPRPASLPPFAANEAGAKRLGPVCLTPNLTGLGGPASFFRRLKDGLLARGVEVSTDLNDPRIRSVLVIAGTRDLPGLLRLKRRGVRIVHRLNGLYWVQRKRYAGLRFTLRAEWSNLLLSFIRRRLADAIVYQSRFSQEIWDRFYGPVSTPSTIVYNGVDLDKYSPEPNILRPADRIRLLVVEGHLGGGNETGLFNAVELASRLHQDHQAPVELVIAGDAPARLRAEAEKRSAAPIVWKGIVPRDEIPALDSSAHLFFSADVNAPCPNSVVEALACGLPVVAFDTGSLSELVRDGAGIVVPYGGNQWNLEPADVPALARAAVQILQNPEPYRLAARRRAEAALGVDRMVDGYLKVFTTELTESTEI